MGKVGDLTVQETHMAEFSVLNRIIFFCNGSTRRVILK